VISWFPKVCFFKFQLVPLQRAVRDLQEEFGFVLGRGNQAYQFDTLPTRLDGRGCYSC
jgi:hypothetical protein